jgi:hypothetical protein
VHQSISGLPQAFLNLFALPDILSQHSKRVRKLLGLLRDPALGDGIPALRSIFRLLKLSHCPLYLTRPFFSDRDASAAAKSQAYTIFRRSAMLGEWKLCSR